MDEEWAPFGLTEDEIERHRVLVDGVPTKLREPIVAWLKQALATGTYDKVENSRTRYLEMLTDVHMGLPDGTYVRWDDYDELFRKMKPDLLLRVVDGVLSAEWYGVSPGGLELALGLCKSKWTVGKRLASIHR